MQRESGTTAGARPGAHSVHTRTATGSKLLRHKPAEVSGRAHRRSWDVPGGKRAGAHSARIRRARTRW